MDQTTKRALWIIAGVVVFIALYRSHHITEAEVIVFCVIVPSIILHEVSHGVVANAFGDDTAKRAGRLTLNPVAHVDPVGTFIVPAVLGIIFLLLFIVYVCFVRDDCGREHQLRRERARLPGASHRDHLPQPGRGGRARRGRAG